jgi:hypothetical protein
MFYFIYIYVSHDLIFLSEFFFLVARLGSFSIFATGWIIIFTQRQQKSAKIVSACHNIKKKLRIYNKK